jgi:hypothetical protein
VRGPEGALAARAADVEAAGQTAVIAGVRTEDGRGNDRTLPGQSLVIAVRDLRPCAA